MRRRQYIKATGAAVTGSALAGCVASDSSATTDPDDAISGGAETRRTSDGDRPNDSETGTLATSVTDQPVDIGDFESCVITIDGLWVKPDEGGSDDRSEADPEKSTTPEGDGVTSETGEAGAQSVEGVEEVEETEESERVEESDGTKETEPAERSEGTEGIEEREGGEGRRYVEFDEPQEADLVQLQEANTQLIDETELPVGGYRYVQLDVSGVEGVLTGGGEAEVDTPGNAPLQFKRRFEIRAGERTRFVADFAPVRRGQGARYLLRPVATGTRVLYGDEEYDPDDGSEGEETEEDGDATGEDAGGEDRSADEGGSDDPDES
jgi:hypothetical protein